MASVHSCFHGAEGDKKKLKGVSLRCGRAGGVAPRPAILGKIIFRPRLPRGEDGFLVLGQGREANDVNSNDHYPPYPGCHPYLSPGGRRPSLPSPPARHVAAPPRPPRGRSPTTTTPRRVATSSPSPNSGTEAPIP